MAALACTVCQQARSRLSGRPAGLARWASPAFHLGLLLIATAGFLTYGFQKRGFVQLIKGETFLGKESDFLNVERGPLAGSFELPFAMRLQDFRHSYWEDGEARDFRSTVSIFESGKASEMDLSVNAPLRLGPVNVYQSGYYGYSVSLALRRPSGERLVTHFLLDRPSRPGRPAVGGSDFPTTDYDFRLDFRPDRAGGPALFVTVKRRDALVYRGPVPMDRAIRVGNDELSVAGIRPWSGLIFVEDRSSALLAAGLILTVGGALLMCAFPGKRQAYA